MALREDKIGFGDLILSQDEEAFCYGIDAVLIANYLARNVKRPPARICDLGCGNGILVLLMSYYFTQAQIVGIEIQEDAYELAKKNVRDNGLEDRCRILNLDVKELPGLAERNDLPEELASSFDAVISNPPYVAGGAGIINSMSSKALARHESSADLRDFLSAAAALAGPGGEFYMVHRPTRLAEIFAACQDFRMQPKRLRFVQPHLDKEANIVLLKMIKDGGFELRMEPFLVVRDNNNRFTEEIREIYELD